MKRKCKHIIITDHDIVRPWVAECIRRHKRRYDFRDLLLKHGLNRADYYKSLQTHDCSTYPIDSVTDAAIRMIKDRELRLKPVRIHEQEDKTTGKIRMIGCEEPMQQILDYIAVYSCHEIWRKRIVPQQVSSMPGRGQIYGMKLIRKYIRQDLRCMRYAKKRGIRYVRRNTYFVKLDIKKCFPNAKHEIFMELFRRDCGNPDIVWLWDELLKTHETENYHGFMIGALISQWAAQYMLSFVYREAMRLRERGRKMISRMVMFMDDMLLTNSNRQRLYRAVIQLTGFAKSLGFKIKQSFAIYRLQSVGIDMMGFVMHSNGKVTMRGRNYIKSRRLMLRLERKGTLTLRQAQRLISYKGFYKFSDYSGNFAVFRAAQNIIRKEAVA